MEQQKVAQVLQEHGIRPTLQRMEIANILFQKNRHLTAASLSDKVNQAYPKVSRASIFNTIKLFEEKGLLKRMEISEQETYYDSNIKPHHHLIDKEKKEIHDICFSQELESKIKEMMKEEIQKQNIKISKDMEINITAFLN